jgi:hypothetical protein
MNGGNFNQDGALHHDTRDGLKSGKILCSCISLSAEFFNERNVLSEDPYMN